MNRNSKFGFLGWNFLRNRPFFLIFCSIFRSLYLLNLLSESHETSRIERIHSELSFDIKIIPVAWKLASLEFFESKFEHFFPPHAGVHTRWRRPGSAHRWSTCGGYNFRADGRNRSKPSPNESSEFIFSFGEGFERFRPSARMLQPPEVGLDFRKNPGAAGRSPRPVPKKSKKLKIEKNHFSSWVW